jgi:cytochrome c-type biogenesis protein CcmE
MTRKRRRLIVLLACAVCLGSATALTLIAFKDNLVFFMSPADILAHAPPVGRMVRLGGVVQAGSVKHLRNGGKPAVRFRVTDGNVGMLVDYVGVLPDLFREGQGVVTMGTIRPDGSFLASEVLAKHDSTYMPKEVAEALKKSGHWNPDNGPPPAAATWNTMTPAEVGE